MEKFAKSGDFCPNEACPDYGKLQEGQTQHNIRKFGRTRAGVQRYHCQTCHRTFTETTGTLFFRKRTPEHEILETLALLAEGSRISSLSRAKGIKEDTIRAATKARLFRPSCCRPTCRARIDTPIKAARTTEGLAPTKRV
jgi:hypothetical protein